MSSHCILAYTPVVRQFKHIQEINTQSSLALMISQSLKGTIVKRSLSARQERKLKMEHLEECLHIIKTLLESGAVSGFK